MKQSRPLTTEEKRELLKLRNETAEAFEIGDLSGDYEVNVARRDELIAIESANREADSIAAWNKPS
jgi:hypothetical protein